MQWSLVPLEQVVSVNPRGHDCQDLSDEVPVSFVPMESVSEESAAITQPLVRPLSEVRRGYTFFKDGDVLFAKITPCMENGKSALARGLENGRGFGSTEFHVLRAGPQVLPEFLHYFVRRDSFRRAAKQHMRGGAGQQRVPEDFLKKELIPLPTPREQRRIVEILDRADHLRHLRADAEVKADRILPALFRKVFLDPVSAWPTEPLERRLRKSKGALQSGPFGSHLHNSDFVESGTVRVVGIDNVLDGEFSLGRNRRITAEKYEELKKYTLAPGDILVTIMGTVGRTCVFPHLREAAICTKHVYRIQVDEQLNPEYVCASIRFAPAVREQLGASTTGQIVAGITSDSIRKLQLLVPPRELQDRFALHARTLSQERTERRQAAVQLDCLFETLLRGAFSGKLTRSWREAHMKELLQEIEQQAKVLASVDPRE